jgi:hypothetical protein
LRASTCEATPLLSWPTLDAAAGVAGAGDAAGEGPEGVAAARGLAAGLVLAQALVRVLGLGFGEAEEPGEERKLMPGSAGEEEDPGDDDAGEETARLRARMHAGAASNEGMEEFGFGLALALPRLVLDAAAVALGLPMASDDGGVYGPRGEEERQVKRARPEMCFGSLTLTRGFRTTTTRGSSKGIRLTNAVGHGGVRFRGPHVTGTC